MMCGSCSNENAMKAAFMKYNVSDPTDYFGLCQT